MLRLLTFIALLCSANVFAQRLYVHEIQDGNYLSYGEGSRIRVLMLDSSNVTSGTISKLDSNAFYLKEGQYVQLRQIASILPYDKSKGVKRFFTAAVGVFCVATGTIYFIAGAAYIQDDAAVGLTAMAASAGLITGGLWLIKRNKKLKTQVKQIFIDNVQYRVFIQ